MKAIKFAMAGALLAVSALASAEEAVLKVSAIPDEAPTELQRKFAPLGAYLEKELGMKVQFVPVTDYAAVVTALTSDKIDMAWLGGFTFVQASQRGKVVPLVQREEDSKFTSKYIANTEAGINSLKDLKGKSFAFGSASSTSGHLMPRYFLQKQGIKPETFFKNVAYSGAHDATVAWVASGKVEGGVLNASVWDKLVEAGKVDLTKVKLLGTTPAYYDYNWTVRGNLDAKLQQKITKAFLKLDPKNPEQQAILELQRASKFIPTKAANYKGIESAAKAAGLLK
ncbi:putative selenate ABC transporter substrate-binding protein [Pseudogulbenkiania ferrooxidans]|uniref:Phosphonate ABC transporter, periplasmic phosphonate-binding protein n=1 Tax=Pseudogulbenkiania ferrooxidans 2002 TaxID=279714 RepID=B9Z118_9NEIS|nr:putative selenate ABC transporter substrate-binding protein [Pseudogulbenkiania ferrooxidans]EEG09113.1 phosphonate ABC transporter, periplasmic phosphonate-binding protein [Pseudogulbenkiania ferrooxidans 2002]